MAIKKYLSFAFTLNNPTFVDHETCKSLLEKHPDKVVYFMYGHEGYGLAGGVKSGRPLTPHLQGTIVCKTPMSWKQVKELISVRCHIEPIRTLIFSSVHYCTKEGIYVCFGNLQNAIFHHHLQYFFKHPVIGEFKSALRELGQKALVTEHKQECYAYELQVMELAEMMQDHINKNGG